MARKTFFSFRYEKDNWRASTVRNSWVCEGCQEAGFFDSVEWEKVKKGNDESIKKWIDEQLKGTSVTVVLIGEDTYGKKWINYEIESSYKKGNALLGIYIHNLKNKDKNTCPKGKNPFDYWTWSNGKPDVYDWVNDDGYNNIGKWIENAAKKAHV